MRHSSSSSSRLLLLAQLLASSSSLVAASSPITTTSSSPSSRPLATPPTVGYDDDSLNVLQPEQSDSTTMMNDEEESSGAGGLSFRPEPNDDRGPADSLEAIASRGGGSSDEPPLHVEEFDAPDDPWSRLGGGRVNERPRRRQRASASPAAAADGDIVASAAGAHDSGANSIEHGFDPVRYKSHLWHALEGLDRYPNYLSRWNDGNDITRLEQALQEQLDRVKSQRRSVQSYKHFVRSVVAHDEQLRSSPVLLAPRSWQELRDRRILDSTLVDAILASKHFRTTKAPPPSLEALCSGRVTGIDLDVSQLVQLMDEEVPDVFALPILTREFGGALCDWVDAVSARVRHHLASRTLVVPHETTTDVTDWDSWQAQSRRPLDLCDVGLEWLVNLLFNVVVQPISKHLFGEEIGVAKGQLLDWKQAFVAGYSPAPAAMRNTAAPRQHLVSHTDDSEVTLNVCLGRDFAGGVLQFEGLRGQSSPQDPTNPQYEYEPQPGRGVIHTGRHFHSVSPVTAGSRYALILWARSWKGIRTATCPCCWLNRRTAKDRGAAQPCIAGPQWN